MSYNPFDETSPKDNYNPFEDVGKQNNNDDSYYEATKDGFLGGVGQLMSGATKAMESIGKPSYMTSEEWHNNQTPFIKNVENTGDEIKENYQKQYDPYTGKWFANGIANTVPVMLGLATTSAAAIRSGNMQYAEDATKMGAGLLGATPMVAKVAGALVPAATVGLGMQFPESAMEGQDAYDESIRKGYPPEKAEEVRQAVIKANVGLLTGTNTVENLLTFGKLPFKIPGSVVNRFVEKALITTAKTGTVAGTEAFEEAAQQIIPKIATNEDWNLGDEDVKQAAVLGAGAGVLFHGFGSGINKIADYRERKATERADNSNPFNQDDISISETNNPTPAGPSPVVNSPALPIADNVEDYNGVKYHVKQGSNNFGSWLQSIGINPIITSGKRSVENNALVNGAENSWHLSGDAVDIGVGDITPEQQEVIKAKAKEAGWGEVLYHDAGNGLHLHLANLQDGSNGSVASNINSESSLLAESGDFKDIINEAAKEYGISPELIAAVMKQESSFNPTATSPTGAIGLMQLMPDTAAELEVDPNDVRGNIMGGAKYLKQQLDAFGGDTQKALAAYNAGADAVQKHNGIPPYAETQNYVKKIMSSLENSKSTSTYANTQGSISTSNIDALTDLIAKQKLSNEQLSDISTWAQNKTETETLPPEELNTINDSLDKGKSGLYEIAEKYPIDIAKLFGLDAKAENTTPGEFSDKTAEDLTNQISNFNKFETLSQEELRQIAISKGFNSVDELLANANNMRDGMKQELINRQAPPANVANRVVNNTTTRDMINSARESNKPFLPETFYNDQEKLRQQQSLIDMLGSVNAGKFDQAEQQSNNNSAIKADITNDVQSLEQRKINQQKIAVDQQLANLTGQQPGNIELPNHTISPESLKSIKDLKQSLGLNNLDSTSIPNDILKTSEQIGDERRAKYLWDTQIKELSTAVNDKFKDYNKMVQLANKLAEIAPLTGDSKKVEYANNKVAFYKKLIPAGSRIADNSPRETITADDIKRSVNYNNLNDIEKLFIDMLQHYDVTISTVENELLSEYNGIINQYEAILWKQVKQPGIPTVGENKSGDKFTRMQSGNFQWFLELAKQHGYANANKLPKTILAKAIPEVALSHLRNGYIDSAYGEQVPESEASKFNDLEVAINGIKQTRGKLEPAVPNQLGANERSSTNDRRIIQERTEQAVAIGKQLGQPSQVERTEPARVKEQTTPTTEIQSQNNIENEKPLIQEQNNEIVPLVTPVVAQEDVKSSDLTNTIPMDEKTSKNSYIIPEHTITESVHTKTGKPIWIVRLVNRVDRIAYQKINSEMKKIGGHYSSFKGVNGFVFNENPAEKLGDVAASDVKQTNQDEIKQHEIVLDAKIDNDPPPAEWLTAINEGSFSASSFSKDNNYGPDALTELRVKGYIKSFNNKLVLSEKGKNLLEELLKDNSLQKNTVSTESTTDNKENTLSMPIEEKFPIGTIVQVKNNNMVEGQVVTYKKSQSSFENDKLKIKITKILSNGDRFNNEIGQYIDVSPTEVSLKIIDNPKGIEKLATESATPKETLSEDTGENPSISNDDAEGFNAERAKNKFLTLVGKNKAAKKINIVDDSDAALDAAIKDALKELNNLSANPVFNPKLMATVFKVGAIYIQRGVNNVKVWSEQMVDTLGEKTREFLPSVWESIHAWPSDHKYNDEIANAVFEYVGSQFHNGITDKETIRKSFVEFAGEEYSSLIDSAYAGIKEWPSFKNDKAGADNSDSTYVLAVKNISNWVQQKIESGEKFSNQELFDQSDKAFEGRQGEGVYTPKDAYDAMELGINNFLLKQNFANPENAKTATEAIAALKEIKEKIMDILPTQAKRTAEQEEFQQFSTPPHIAYVASWVSAINKNDTVVEPSAGVGGLAIFAKATGANVIVNELSTRRAEILKTLPFDQVFGENAEQIDNILSDDIKPTVVNMNPPFSSTAGRMEGKRATKNATLHIEQALNRLEPNGRLVAIVGQGMSDDAASFKTWWNKIKSQYNVRANVGIDGGFAKYGTGFGTQMFVIDKTGKTESPTITGTFSNVEDILSLLEGIKNDRETGTNRLSEQTSSESNSENLSDKGRDNTGPDRGPLSVPADRVGTRNGRSGNERPINSNLSARSDSEVIDEKPIASNKVPSESRRGKSSNSNVGQSKESTNADGRSNVSDGSIGNSADGSLIDTQHVETATADAIMSESTFDSYQPQRLSIRGAKPHPSPLVQSAAMAAVEPPIPTYKPNLPAEVITKGKLSIAQLEPIVYAGQAFENTLPNGTRRGYFIGDGTGVGKGREISGIIMDDIRNGQKKAIWVSKNDALFDDAIRDWTDLGGTNGLLFPLKKTKLGDSIKQPGILFTTYPTLASNLEVTGNGEVKNKPNAKSRLSQIVDWLGKDFDGVIAFDESHMMANSIATKGKRGTKKASARGLAGVELQKLLPNAKIVYVSATGATEVENLAYASRLGLWGEGTPFSNVQDFVDQIKSSGLAGMELVARDMKAMGVYLARNLSFDGVTYGTITHDLTMEQREIYDTMAKGWQIVLQNINDALKVTGAINEKGKVTNGDAKKNAMGQFWGSQQRFFNQVLTSMQMPSVIEDVKNQIKNGNAIVMQLVNTNEATMNRQLSSMEEDQSLDDLDMTPRDILMQYLDKSFPVQQYEDYTDDEGNIRSRAVVDKSGKPVLNREAVRMKEILMNKLGSMKVPEGPLELIINTFGTKVVGEITGRQRRVVREKDSSGQTVSKIEKRSKAHNKADVKAFMDDKKAILIFSEAGGTGQSFHTDPKVKNQRRRIHYLIQPGWRADSAVQGFGRTHRSGEISQPHYVLVTTNLKGQKRFISTIARRLDQLGALTKGQRDAANQGLFSAKDNLESEYAKDALQKFYENLMHNAYKDIDTHSMLVKMGLESLTKQDEQQSNRGPASETLRDVPKFLNRILALDSTEQNQVFDYFSDILDQNIEAHIANGTLDSGMETLRSEGVQVKEEKTVYVDPKSNAETKYINLDVKHKNETVPYQVANSARNFIGFYQNIKNGNIWAVRAGATRTNERGMVTDTIVLQSPSKNRYRSADKSELAKSEISKDGWKLLNDKQSKELWEEALNKEPKFRTETMHMITGAILPIWNRLPQGHSRVIRVQSDDGKIFLGRIIRERDINTTLRNLGAAVNINFTSSEIQDKILIKNNEATLSNGWKIARRRVSGEQRIEIIGNDLWKFDSQFKSNGIIQERINYNTRYFLPNGDNFTKSFDWLVKDRPIVDVTVPETNSNAALNFGFDPTFGKFNDVDLIAEIKKLSANIKETTPGLIELGKRTVADGYTKSGEWARKMRDHLGDSWSKFKAKVIDIWKLVKDTVSNERGAIGKDNEETIVFKETVPDAGKITPLDKITRRLLGKTHEQILADQELTNRFDQTVKKWYDNLNLKDKLEDQYHVEREVVQRGGLQNYVEQNAINAREGQFGENGQLLGDVDAGRRGEIPTPVTNRTGHNGLDRSDNNQGDSFYPEKDKKYKLEQKINANKITLAQLQQKFPTLKFSEFGDGYQATIPNGHVVEIKLNQDITPDYDSVLKAYGKEVADAVQRGEIGALGSTEPSVIVTKEGKIAFGAIVELAKKADLGTLDHETVHMVDMLGLIPENAWRALERKYDPKGTMSRSELEELVAEEYRKWNGQSNTVFSRIKKFFTDLYDLVASPETISLYKSISDGSIFQQRSNTEQSASFSGELATSKYKYKYSLEDIKKHFGFATTDNVSIVDKPKTGINPFRYFMQSAGRLAEINPKIKPFVREALKSDEANETMRNDFTHKMDKVMGLLKDKADLSSWTDVMWLGDALQQEFTNTELRQEGHNDNVIKAYRMARVAIDKAYNLANDIHQGIEIHSKNLTRGELADLKNNPFITEIISERPSADGLHTLVTYKAPKIREINGQTVTAQQLDEMSQDENIQVLKVRDMAGHVLPGAQTIVHGDETYSVDYIQQKAPINKLDGYVSHIFHEWTIYRKDEQPDGTFKYVSEASESSIRKATQIANELSAKLPDIEFVIKPKSFSMPGAVEASAVVGDNEYFRIIKELEDTYELSTADARELADHSVSMRSRGRFLSSKLHRTGAAGYEQNVEKVLRGHFNQVSRYVALDPFKRKAISLFEKYYGRFDNKHTGEADFVQGYINDVNGNPTAIEKTANDIIATMPIIGKLVSTFAIGRPSTALAGSIMKWTGIAKLGLPNIASSLINFSQLIGAGAKLNDFGALTEGIKHTSNLSLTDRKVLRLAGVDASVGLASGAGYTDAKRFQGTVTNFIMYPFSWSEKTIRKITVLSAYHQGIAKGMSSTEAINYAKKINNEVNFNYGISDTPRFIRGGGPVTQVMFQFQKYPVKMLELMHDITKNGDLKQNMRFWLPTLAIAGYWGIPGFGLVVGPVLGAILKHLFGFDGDDWEQVLKAATFKFAEGNKFLEAGVKASWYGGLSLGAGIDVSKRSGIGEFASGGMMPKTGWEAAFKTLGAGGSTIYNAFVKSMEGDSIGAIKAVSPGLGNVYAAIQGQQEGKRGRIKNEYETLYERVVKGVGFRPIDESIDSDIKMIIDDARKKNKDDKQQAIDDYIANPTSQKAIDRLGELRVTRQQIVNETKQKNMTNLERTNKNMSRQDKGKYYNLEQFGK